MHLFREMLVVWDPAILLSPTLLHYAHLEGFLLFHVIFFILFSKKKIICHSYSLCNLQLTRISGNAASPKIRFSYCSLLSSITFFSPTLLGLIFTAVIFCSRLSICWEKRWGGGNQPEARGTVVLLKRSHVASRVVTMWAAAGVYVHPARETTHTDANKVDDRKSMEPSGGWRKHSAASAHSQNLLLAISADSFTIFHSFHHCTVWHVFMALICPDNPPPPLHPTPRKIISLLHLELNTVQFALSIK